jgi:hypothetical protein
MALIIDDLIDEDRLEQLLAAGKVAVRGRHPDPGSPGDFGHRDLRVGSGITGTDLNFFRGTRTVEQAAGEPVRLALIGADGPTGSFSNDDGPIPW